MHGLGIDLIEIERVERAVRLYGDRFLTRIFTPSEIAYCQTKPNPYPHYAARFAVKEAFSKALGTGIGEALTWKDIEVAREFSGKPSVLLSDRVRNQFPHKSIQISLSHTHQYAAAVVILE
ncbi:MAG: holo-ACP synthase [Bacteroidetes bacterium]|nr:holo-ACP synthase [Bacteroidota bacterium]